MPKRKRSTFKAKHQKNRTAKSNLARGHRYSQPILENDAFSYARYATDTRTIDNGVAKQTTKQTVDK